MMQAVGLFEVFLLQWLLESFQPFIKEQKCFNHEMWLRSTKGMTEESMETGSSTERAQRHAISKITG